MPRDKLSFCIETLSVYLKGCPLYIWRQSKIPFLWYRQWKTLAWSSQKRLSSAWWQRQLLLQNGYFDRDSTLLHFFSECGAKEIPGTTYVIRQMDKGQHCPKGCGFWGSEGRGLLDSWVDFWRESGHGNSGRKKNWTLGSDGRNKWLSSFIFNNFLWSPERHRKNITI